MDKCRCVCSGEELTEGHAGALAGEDEDERGDELGDGRLEGAGLVHLMVAPHGNPADRHSDHQKLEIETGRSWER